MRPYLIDDSLFDKITVHMSVGSTNDLTKELARQGAEHGTVIFAESQTAGKGRRGRSFFSPPGQGIYMSMVLKPDRHSFDRSLTTPFAAVAVCEAIEAVSDIAPQIKWVNDVFADGRKVCGILTEAVTLYDGTQHLVLGIGINFSRPDTGFPAEISASAGAVFNKPDPPVTRSRLAAEILNRVLIQPPDYSDSQMLRKYRRRMMMLGQTVVVTGAGESYEAVALDIDSEARLIVRNNAGETIYLSSGEISVRSL